MNPPSQVWLPGYDLQARLGGGVTGEVWRAVHEASGEVVALKRLHPGCDVDVPELRRGLDLLGQLDSPHLVRLREVVATAAGTVLVLDHAGGGSLAALLARRGALTPGEVVAVGVPVAQALAAAHLLGLVHGDLSPASILLADDGRPLLSDLGVARSVAAPGAPPDRPGHYRDPALLAGDEPGPAADVWGLAAVLHHLLAGRPPQDAQHEAGPVERGQDPEDSARGGRAPLAVLAPSVPASVVDAVEAGLAGDPQRRPSASAFAALLRRSHLAVPLDRGPCQPPRGTGPAPRRAVPSAPRHAAAEPAGAAARAQPGRRAWPGLRALVPLTVVLVLLAAAAAGWVSGRRGTSDARPVSVPALPSSPRAASAPSPSMRRLSDPSARPASAPAPSARSSSGPTSTRPTLASPTSRSPEAARAAPERRPGAAAPPGPDWRAVLDGLDSARAAAFAAGDGRLLSRVYVRGSPAGTADSTSVRRLATAGWRALGVRHRLLHVAVVGARPAGTVLRVTDELPAARIVDAGGRLVAVARGRPRASYLVDVRRTPAGWRLATVESAGAAVGG